MVEQPARIELTRLTSLARCTDFSWEKKEKKGDEEKRSYASMEENWGVREWEV